jgi:hypothetical protein
MTKKGDSQQVTNANLKNDIANLTKTVEVGFQGVHERQDETNGKVVKAGTDIGTLQRAHDALSAEFKYNRIIWYMLTISVSTIIALASFIILKR